MIEQLFTIRRPQKRFRTYVAIFPCGTRWLFNRDDLNIPEIVNGEQIGLTMCFDTVKQAKEELASLGVRVEIA